MVDFHAEWVPALAGGLSIGVAQMDVTPGLHLSDGACYRSVIEMDDIPITRVVPSEHHISLEPFSMTFEEIEVEAGVPPILPDGSEGITDREAVMAIVWFLGQPGPDVHYAARYGIYSSPFPGRGSPTGEVQPLHQNRLVWLITGYGPGVRISLSHPVGGPDPGVKHQYNILIDAATGERLGMFG